MCTAHECSRPCTSQACMHSCLIIDVAARLLESYSMPPDERLVRQLQAVALQPALQACGVLLRLTRYLLDQRVHLGHLGQHLRTADAM